MSDYNNQMLNYNDQIVEPFSVSNLIKHENLIGLTQSRREIFQAKLDNKASPTEAYKIPTELHYVWFTSSNSPREISKNDIDNVLHNQKLFSSSNLEWNSIVHTNNKNLIPESVKILEENGIKVENLGKTITDPVFFETLEPLVNKKEWGLASDYTRYKIMLNGGVYLDLNFKAIRTIDTEMKTYDFVAQDCINYFFAVKPNHEIIEGLVQKVEENINTPPAYIQSIDSKDIFTKTVVSSLLPFCMSYLKYAHQGNNQDIIFPSSNGYFLIAEGNSFPESDSYWAVARLNNAFGHLNEYPLIGIDGADGSHITWIEA